MAAWQPYQPGALLTLFDHWAPLMPRSVTARFLRDLVLPVLRKAAADWDWRAAGPPPHVWLHPWLPHLSVELQDTYPMIRTKLAAWLQVRFRPHWTRANCLQLDWRCMTGNGVGERLDTVRLGLLTCCL